MFEQIYMSQLPRNRDLTPNSDGKVIIKNVQHWLLLGDKNDNKLTQVTTFAMNQLPTDSKQIALQAQQKISDSL